MSKHILRKHVHGFTTVSNNVIKVLKGDLPALGLYLYLLSLPNDWEFYKTQLAKDCSIGIKKLEKILKGLSGLGLVQYGQKRDEKGRFEQFYMDIYDTETLKIKELEEEKPSSTHPNSPVGQNCRTARTVGRFGEATKEVITKEVFKKQNKDKSFCVPQSSKAENQDQKQVQKPVSQRSGVSQANSIKHDWAPMKNEKSNIDQNETFKRALPPPQLKEIVKMLKRKSMVV